MGMQPKTIFGYEGQQQVPVFGIPQEHQLSGPDVPIYGVPTSLEPGIQSQFGVQPQPGVQFLGYQQMGGPIAFMPSGPMANMPYQYG